MRFAVIAVALQAASSVSAVLVDGLCSTKLGVSSVKNVPTSTTTMGLPLTAYLAKCAHDQNDYPEACQYHSDGDFNFEHHNNS